MPLDQAVEQATWGWAGTADTLLETECEDVVNALVEHHVRFFGFSPSRSQLHSWRKEVSVVHEALRQANEQLTGAGEWGVVFEYELPLEGGRRPDVVVLAGATVVVLEFKDEPIILTAHFDQAEAYARDIGDYHSASRNVEVVPCVVPTADVRHVARRHGVQLVRPRSLGDFLTGLPAGVQIDLNDWINGKYAPLPTLVNAARRIFEHKHLPHVHRAVSARVPETVQRVSELIAEAETEELRRLVLVSGVPGAGKTLVGLRAVYEHAQEHAPATFLSGNGPLVQVLQDALESRVFVRDLHAYIRTHGISGKPPTQNVVVFDEAQRAWDADYMSFKKGVERSEPELLIDTADRMPHWATLVGLVGEGQEIYSGEEGGLGQWHEAIGQSTGDWQVVCPPHLSSVFSGLDVVEEPLLHLDVPLRSRRAESIHLWVSHLLGGELERAEELAHDIRSEGFPMWLSRDLEAVKHHAVTRYQGEQDARFGLVASSQAKNLAAEGVDNTFQATKRVKIARWFNDAPGSPLSGQAMTQPITEFQCQGLEVDLPIVCWGDDLAWAGHRWITRAVRRQYKQHDPESLLINSYRVLLTRGRDGVVVWVPAQTRLDETASALEQAGVLPLPQ